MKIAVKIMLAMMMSLSAVAVAQRGPPPSADEMVERMTEHLGLNDEQQVAVRNLLEQNKPEKGADREASRAAVDAGLQSILTAEQLDEYITQQASRESRPQGGPGGGAQGGNR